MSAVDLLHERPNGMWSLAMAEVNKKIFFKAYLRKVDDVTERKALREARAWLDRTSESDFRQEDSPLLEKWLSNPPKTEDDWKWWIAVHQRHLFVPLAIRGSFYSRFPAILEKHRVPNYKLTQLFCEALELRSSGNSSSS